MTFCWLVQVAIRSLPWNGTSYVWQQQWLPVIVVAPKWSGKQFDKIKISPCSSFVFKKSYLRKRCNYAASPSATSSSVSFILCILFGNFKSDLLRSSPLTLRRRRGSSPVPTGWWWWWWWVYSPQIKLQAPPNWNMKHNKAVEFYYLQTVKTPCTNVKPLRTFWRWFCVLYAASFLLTINLRRLKFLPAPGP